MLAAPPAAAMTYVKESRGLKPSVYGGGGSESSWPLLELSPFLSGKAALVSSTRVDRHGLCCEEAGSATSEKGGAGAKAGGGAEDEDSRKSFVESSFAWWRSLEEGGK